MGGHEELWFDLHPRTLWLEFQWEILAHFFQKVMNTGGFIPSF
jgi:hypothetical protein